MKLLRMVFVGLGCFCVGGLGGEVDIMLVSVCGKLVVIEVIVELGL